MILAAHPPMRRGAIVFSQTRNVRIGQRRFLCRPSSQLSSRLTTGTSDPEIVQAPREDSEFRENNFFSQTFESVLVGSRELRDGSTADKPVTRTLQTLFNNMPHELGVQNVTSPLLKPNEQLTTSLRPTEEPNYREALRTIAPVVAHIEMLTTNAQVVDYFKSSILPAFELNYKRDLGLNGDSSPTTARAWPTCLAPVNLTTSAAIMNKSLDTLLNVFHDPMSSLHLVDLARQAGIDVYRAMCDVNVYNKLISIRWEEFRDLQATVDTVSSMFIHAISGNSETAALLDNISRDVMEGKRTGSLPLWSEGDRECFKQLLKYRTHILEALASSSSGKLRTQLSMKQ